MPKYYFIIGLMTSFNFLAPTSKAYSILTIGDSIVAKYPGSSERNITGWGVTLSQNFNLDITNFQNKAVGGSTTKSFYNTYWVPDHLANALKPNLILIEFGHNDAYRDDYVSPVDFGTYLRKYLNETRQSNPNAEIVFVSPPVRYYYLRAGVPDNTEFQPYRDIMQKVANEDGAILVDLFAESLKTLSVGPNAYTESLFSMYEIRPGVKDITHFSLAGATLWANKILDSLCAQRNILHDFRAFNSALKNSCSESD